ncbi:unnamed protein product, partial [Ectocarpus fasciculatus]
RREREHAACTQRLMNREHRSASHSSWPRSILMVPPLVAFAISTAVVSAGADAASAEAAAAYGTQQVRRAPQGGFVPSPRLGGLRHGKRRGLSGGEIQAVQSARDSARSGEGAGGVAVHDESWYLGDGGFAERHLEDEDRLAAKKDEKAFFRERSLSVYDQMKEASMLLLAQQQILAAEETREEASKPRFVAAAGGSMAARAQAARDRQRKRNAVRGLLPDAPAASTAPPASGAASSPASRDAPV